MAVLSVIAFFVLSTCEYNWSTVSGGWGVLVEGLTISPDVFFVAVFGVH